MFTLNVTKLLSSIISFFLFFFYFFNWFFYLFLLYIFILNSSLFCGDITHGRGSYLLIMHSTLAIFTKILWYIYLFIFCFFLYFYLKILHYYYYYSLFFYFLFIFSLFGLFYNILFLVTGLVWGDYSWGFSISIEFRFFLLCLYICYYFFVCIYSIGSFSIFYLLILHFFFISLLLLINLISWFQFFPYIFEFLSFLNLNIIRVELHQSESSLHFFLLSISGYYISLIFIYFIYLFFILFFSILLLFLYFFFIFNFFLKEWYLINNSRIYLYFICLQFLI